MTPSAEPTSDGAQVAAHLVPADLLEGGEVVILALKPSGWFVLLASLPVLASATVVAGAAYVVDIFHPPTPAPAILSFALAGVCTRAVFACWQWLGRTYVLTNRRIVSLCGLVNTDVQAAALTDVGRAAMAAAWVERILAAGTIFCLGPQDDASGPASAGADVPARALVTWSAVAHPQDVLEIVQEAIGRARRGSRPPAADEEAEP